MEKNEKNEEKTLKLKEKMRFTKIKTYNDKTNTLL
jgi:hypothetical protein